MEKLSEFIRAALGLFRFLFIYGGFIALMVSNVLLLTSSDFFSSASDLISNIPFSEIIEHSPGKVTKRLKVEKEDLLKKNQVLVSEHSQTLKRLDVEKEDLLKRNHVLVSEHSQTLKRLDVEKEDLLKRNHALVSEHSQALKRLDVEKEDLLKKNQVLVSEHSQALKRLDVEKEDLLKKNQVLVSENSQTLKRLEVERDDLLKKNHVLVSERSQTLKRLEVENEDLLRKNKELVAERNIFRAKAKDVGYAATRIAKRTARNVGIGMTTMVMEAIPYAGIAAVTASTALDVKDGCDTIRDTNEIRVFLEDEKDYATESQVCGIKVPSAEELADRVKRDLGETIGQAEKNLIEQAGKFNEVLGGTVYEVFN